MLVEDKFIVDEDTGHRLYEMARMNPPEDNLAEGVEIWVYAEGHHASHPHFHICKDRPHESLDIEVSIKKIDELNISQSKTGHSSWIGLEKMHDAIKKWLNRQAFDADMTNKEAIRQEWNRCNLSNRVKKSEL